MCVCLGERERERERGKRVNEQAVKNVNPSYKRIKDGRDTWTSGRMD